MTKYILKRLILAMIALLLIFVIVFFMMGITNRVPVDASDFIKHKDYVKYLKAKHLDVPIYERFAFYVKNLFSHGQFGQIYSLKTSVQSIPKLFFGPLKYTLFITIPSFIIATFTGISLGTLAGYKRGTFIDAGINMFVILFTAAPSFVLAAVALIIGPKIGLPVSFIRMEDGGFWLMLKSCILPIVVLTLAGIALSTYLSRNEVVSILESNQVLIARSKGLKEGEVFRKHVFRNMIIPLINIMVGGFLIFLGGSLVIETFFQIPGTSKTIVDAVANSEYDIVMFNTLFFTGLGLIAAIITDVIYVLIDPRIKYANASEWKSFAYMKNKITRMRAAESAGFEPADIEAFNEEEEDQDE